MKEETSPLFGVLSPDKPEPGYIALSIWLFTALTCYKLFAIRPGEPQAMGRFTVRLKVLLRPASSGLGSFHRNHKIGAIFYRFFLISNPN